MTNIIKWLKNGLYSVIQFIFNSMTLYDTTCKQFDNKTVLFYT